MADALPPAPAWFRAARAVVRRLPAGRLRAFNLLARGSLPVRGPAGAAGRGDGLPLRSARPRRAGDVPHGWLRAPGGGAGAGGAPGRGHLCGRGCQYRLLHPPSRGEGGGGRTGGGAGAASRHRRRAAAERGDERPPPRAGDAGGGGGYGGARRALRVRGGRGELGRLRPGRRPRRRPRLRRALRAARRVDGRGGSGLDGPREGGRGGRGAPRAARDARRAAGRALRARAGGDAPVDLRGLCGRAGRDGGGDAVGGIHRVADGGIQDGDPARVLRGADCPDAAPAGSVRGGRHVAARTVDPAGREVA